MVKAIFFDADGTLISHTCGAVPKSTVEAVYQLKQKGILLFMATGRHLSELRKLPGHDLPFDGYVTLNGQICCNAQGDILYDAPIDDADTKRIVSLFHEKKLPIILVQRQRMYINFVNQTVRDVQKAISSGVPLTGTYSGGKIYQCILYESKDAAREIMAQLPNCGISCWNPHACDVTPKTGGKVSGIRQILSYFHIRQEETMAFGDGENDIQMLRFAGIGVAMGNAEQEVKGHADYVTTGVNQDGIMIALKHFGLL